MTLEKDIVSKRHAIWSFILGSIIVSLTLLAVSILTFPLAHGQTDLMSADKSNLNSSEFSHELGFPFYTENAKFTNIKVKKY